VALPRENRLKGKKLFDYIFKNGNTAKGRFLLIKYTKTSAMHPKIGFIVPARIVKKAVRRNRIKRLLANEIQKGLTKIKKDAVVLILRMPLPKESQEGQIIGDIKSLVHNLYE